MVRPAAPGATPAVTLNGTSGPLTGASVHDRIESGIRAVIGTERYIASFENKALFRMEDGRLEVAVPNKVLAGLLERRFGTLVREVATAEIGPAPVAFTVAPDLFGPQAERMAATAQVEVKPAITTPTAPGQLKATPKSAILRQQALERFRLEAFVVGESNRLAYNASVQMAEGDRDGKSYGALFLHGPCGVGKTHLLNGIALRFKERMPGATTRITSAETFMNEYVQSVRAGDVERFRRQYRRVDLLCIDDVHFLSNKQATQGELLHTLDEIERCGARIVLVSDEHPRQIRQFSAALVSRFMAGMVAPVATPDAELRKRVVGLFAKARGLTLDDAATALLVERTGMLPGQAGCSVRDIEGLITKIDALQRLAPDYGARQGRVGALAVERALSGSSAAHDLNGTGGASGSAFGAVARSAKPARIETIIAHTCSALAIDSADLSGKTRHKRVVAARALITHLARQYTTLSFPEIARAIGRPNHSTVITAFQRLAKQLEADEAVDAPGAPEARTLPVLLRQLGLAVQASTPKK